MIISSCQQYLYLKYSPTASICICLTAQQSTALKRSGVYPAPGPFITSRSLTSVWKGRGGPVSATADRQSSAPGPLQASKQPDSAGVEGWRRERQHKLRYRCQGAEAFRNKPHRPPQAVVSPFMSPALGSLSPVSAGTSGGWAGSRLRRPAPAATCPSSFPGVPWLWCLWKKKMLISESDDMYPI